MHLLWILVTDCGDAAVTLPLAALVLVVLLVAREWRSALRWLLTVAGCGVAIGVLKLIFGACTSRLGFLAIVSPSGHTAMSTAIYGSLALLIAAPLPARTRRAVLAVAAVLIAAIAVSRLVLQFHDEPEIIVGLAVGLGAVGWFRAGMRRGAPPRVPILGLVLGGVAIVAIMHGTRLMIEPKVHDLAGDFRLVLPWCR